MCQVPKCVYTCIQPHTKNKNFKPRFTAKLGRANNVGGSDLPYHHPHVLLDMIPYRSHTAIVDVIGNLSLVEKIMVITLYLRKDRHNRALL